MNIYILYNYIYIILLFNFCIADGSSLRCSWSPQKSSPFALWLDLSPWLCSSESPQYMEYCDLPESSARTKSLLQTGKKELSCGCPTGAIKGRHIFPEKKNRKSEQVHMALVKVSCFCYNKNNPINIRTFMPQIFR